MNKKSEYTLETFPILLKIVPEQVEDKVNWVLQLEGLVFPKETDNKVKIEVSQDFEQLINNDSCFCNQLNDIVWDRLIESQKEPGKWFKFLKSDYLIVNTLWTYKSMAIAAIDIHYVLNEKFKDEEHNPER